MIRLLFPISARRPSPSTSTVLCPRVAGQGEQCGNDEGAGARSPGLCPRARHHAFVWVAVGGVVAHWTWKVSVPLPWIAEKASTP